MVKEDRKKPAAAAEVQPGRAAFEVMGTINLGRKDGKADIRTQGATVFGDELGVEMTRYLLNNGEIADRNAPIPPSQAERVVAFEHLLELAVHPSIGALTVKGSVYRIAGEDDDEKVYRGITELRNAVSIDQLKELIVKAVS
jgi:hypothetical protein